MKCTPEQRTLCDTKMISIGDKCRWLREHNECALFSSTKPVVLQEDDGDVSATEDHGDNN